MARKKVLIMGAAGRDFHNFQMVYKQDETVQVVAFTAYQIPGIAGRRLPCEIAGPLYPDGIPIHEESELTDLIEELEVEEVVFAYSDVSHEEVMHRASLVMAWGCDFKLLGPDRTMIEANVPVISVCAVRTGAGKSGVSRHIWELLRKRGIRAVDIRHPMPYRDLLGMRCERYASFDDLDRYGVTIEEREEYEHLIEMGAVVMAGVDYECIVAEAEKEAAVIIWDGGNNDYPFIAPDLEIVVLDPFRPGHERAYHPGETNFLRADTLVINKVGTAPPENVEALRVAARHFNPEATVVEMRSAIHVADEAAIRGKKVLVIEDGPTVTHGGMTLGAGAVAAKDLGAALIDPRPYAVGSIKESFARYPHMTEVLPALGYSAQQLAELEATIEAVPCETVVIATPIDLGRVVEISKPTVRVTYGAEDTGSPSLTEVVEGFLDASGIGTED